MYFLGCNYCLDPLVHIRHHQVESRDLNLDPVRRLLDDLEKTDPDGPGVLHRLTEVLTRILFLLPLADTTPQQGMVVRRGMEPLHLPPRDTPNGADEVGPVQVRKPVLGPVSVRPGPELVIRRVRVLVVTSGLKEEG